MKWQSLGVLDEILRLIDENGKIIGSVTRPLTSSETWTASLDAEEGYIGQYASKKQAQTAVEIAAKKRVEEMAEPHRCGGCRFYLQRKQVSSGEPEWGDCRRNAPRVCREDNAGGFPWMYPTDWCGQWEPKP